MSGKVIATVAQESCAGHPAVAAWRKFSGAIIVPKQIDLLRDGRKSAVYRIYGAGPGGASSIIVHRCLMTKAITERLVYEQILPHVPVTSPRFYGLKRENPDYAWIFLEDVGNQRYGENDPVHRNIAGRWLGLLHSAASRVPAARSLPDGGPPRYLSHLRTARDSIRANLANPTLTAGDVDLLSRIAANLDTLEGEWAGIERACAEVPMTVVHGDFRPKNAYIRHWCDGLGIFPIDWETAGWGVPAADLARIDLAAYVSVIHESWWPRVRLEDVERLSTVGAVFRYLASMYWIAPQLAFSDPTYLIKPIASLEITHQNLTESVQKVGVLV
jgi:hypothetical protein